MRNSDKMPSPIAAIHQNSEYVWLEKKHHFIAVRQIDIAAQLTVSDAKKVMMNIIPSFTITVSLYHANKMMVQVWSPAIEALMIDSTYNTY